jgi:hypothetical protein
MIQLFISGFCSLLFSLTNPGITGTELDYEINLLNKSEDR